MSPESDAFRYNPTWMGARILVVDDQIENGKLLDHHLTAAGYEVTVTSKGDDFLETFDRLKPDLCVCDVRMPDVSGITLLRKVKERSSATPVVMFTAVEVIQDVVDAMKAGAFDWVPKPFERERLMVTIRNALAFSSQAGELARLRAQLHESWSVDSIAGSSPALRDAKAMARKLAASDATALVRGESGTGKELFARALHATGPRAKGPFVDVNCAALTESLLESELFGHEKGAFTGATARHVGKFEQAQGGTLFLDEIGDTPAPTQAKLLRVLQERSFQRVGGSERVTVDVRVVAATNQDLEALVAQGRFRQDLLYRINMAVIEIPPLRARLEDLPELATRFAAIAARRERRNAPSIPAETLAALRGHAWPGNVRELENVIGRAVILCDGTEIRPEHLPASIGRGSKAPAFAAGGLEEAVAALERSMILDALEKHGWVKARAARALQVTERILAYKIDAHGITKPR